MTGIPVRGRIVTIQHPWENIKTMDGKLAFQTGFYVFLKGRDIQYIIKNTSGGTFFYRKEKIRCNTVVSVLYFYKPWLFCG